MVRARYMEFAYTFRNSKYIQNLSGCSYCLAPPEYCSRWNKGLSGIWTTKKGLACTYPDVILGIFIVYISETVYAGEYRAKLGSNPIEQQIKELSEEIDWLEGRYIRIFELFVKGAKLLQEEVNTYLDSE